MAVIAATSEGQETAAPLVSRPFAWVIFGLIFGLLLSDYMSRQVLNAVFPLLKTEWGLSDTQLGTLSGIVSVMVGLLTFPLSLAADRWGRIPSLKVMALLWSLATLACGFAEGFGSMFAARFLVGVGEAAYGSVGIAVILSVFPAHLRSSLSGSFLAGGIFGSVLGMAIGGAVAAQLGWRWSFYAMALFGLAMLAVFAFVVTERRVEPERAAGKRRAGAPAPIFTFRTLLPGLFSAKSVIFAYIGNGLQLFIVGALIAWLPSFLNRTYAMATDKAAGMAALFVLVSGVGMIAWGMITDRIARNVPELKFRVAVAISLSTFAFLAIAFRMEPGPVQLALIGVGIFLAGGTTGPSTAMVANVTHVSIHATAFATLSLANNLLGMAPGPIVTGALADRYGLATAFQWVPCICLAAAAAFHLGRRHYTNDLARLRG